MKKFKLLTALSFTFFLSSCYITPANCSTDGEKIIYGVELSFRSSSYWGEDADGDDKHIGSIGFGGYFYWTFLEETPKLQLYSGMYYNQFGAKYSYSTNDNSVDRLHYLTIPITFTYIVFEGIRIEIGPDISFLLAAKEKNNDNGQESTYDFKDSVKKVQIGFNIGASYTHGPSGLGGFIRYNGGLNQVPAEGDYKLYNGGISFGARYILNHLFNKTE